MITEVFEGGGTAPGQMVVPLSNMAPRNIGRDLTELGVVYITPQELDPRQVGDAGIKARARYAGILQEYVRTNNTHQIFGAGPAILLGDEAGDIGASVESQAFENDTMATVLAAVTPAAFTVGSVTEPAGTFTGDFDAETALEVYRALAAHFGHEFRLNPDFTVDFGPESVLFPSSLTANEQSRALITRRDAGPDPRHPAFLTHYVSSHRDHREYVDRAIITKDQGSSMAITGSLDRAGATNYYSPNGGLIKRTVIVGQPPGDVQDAASYLAGVLDRYDSQAEETISTDDFEIDEQVQVGDTANVYDPPTFVDNAGPEVPHRGQLVRASAERLLRLDWSLTRGQGVYFRPPLAVVTGADYINLTRWIEWERT